MKTQSINYLGMFGEGATKAQARRDAEEKIRAALSRDYTPRLLEWRGERILCWQNPYGPCLSLLTTTGEVSCATQYPPDVPFATVLSDARVHLAQLTWDGEEEISPLLDERENARFTSWVRWQKRYRQHKAAGHTDVDCHAFASHLT